MKVWVTGSNGMLGRELIEELRQTTSDLAATDRDVDITDINAVYDYVAGNGPFEWIINCAAWTAVDEAEENWVGAQKLNSDGPRHLSVAANDSRSALVHISTDYVFDGTKRTPYTPDDDPRPAGVYGRTKLTGEREIQAALDRYVIVRTAWLYGRFGSNFVRTMLQLMNERDQVRIVADQVGAPTNAQDLARAIVAVVTAPEPQWGIYHYTNSGEISWYTFAQEIYNQGRAMGLITRECELVPVTTDQYPTKAHRPPYSVLSSRKMCDTFQVLSPDWKESLYRFLQAL